MFERTALEQWRKGQSVVFELDLSDLPGFVSAFSDFLEAGDWVFLEGDLGSGKTTFVKNLALSLGFQQPVSSPSFPILNVLNAQSDSQQIQRLCHLDLYRLKSEREIAHLGFELEFSRRSIALIEWAETIDSDGWRYFFQTTGCRQPRRVIDLKIEYLSDQALRKYTLSWLNVMSLLGED